MKIHTTQIKRPPVSTFTLTLSERELQLIEQALYVDNDHDANIPLWDKINDVLTAKFITTLRN
jgi:hypothetical protein